LWYTFVIDKPGTVSLKVDIQNARQAAFQLRFAVYKSDVDANLSFSQVQSGGLVDSTLLQGLEFVAQNKLTISAKVPMKFHFTTTPAHLLKRGITLL
jgi:hypothetical protein